MNKMVGPPIHTVIREKVHVRILRCTALLPSLLVLSSQSQQTFLLPCLPLTNPPTNPTRCSTPPRYAHRLAPARARPASGGRFQIHSGVSWRRISGAVRSDLGEGPVLAGSKRGIYEGAAALWMGGGILGLIRDGLRCRI
jgi:hypothetical protein